MAEGLVLLILVLVAALIFDYINGFHDAANSIATVVTTRVLSPGQAVMWAAFFNFVAAFFFGTWLSQCRSVIATQGVTFVDPDLDTDDAVGGLGFGSGVVDVSAQSVQWHAAFAVPLSTRNFDTVQTASRHDFDALGTQTHGVLHGALHGAAEHDPLFELLRDAVSDQLGIDFGFAHFLDVHGHWHTQT